MSPPRDMQIEKVIGVLYNYRRLMLDAYGTVFGHFIFQDERILYWLIDYEKRQGKISPEIKQIEIAGEYYQCLEAFGLKLLVPDSGRIVRQLRMAEDTNKRLAEEMRFLKVDNAKMQKVLMDHALMKDTRPTFLRDEDLKGLVDVPKRK